MDVMIKVKGLIARLTKMPLEKVADKSDIRKLGIDSLMVLELIANIERTFRIRIPEGKIRSIKRVDQISELIIELKRSGGVIRTKKTALVGS